MPLDFHDNLLIGKPFSVMVAVRSYCKAYSVSQTFHLQYCLLVNAVGNMGRQKMLQRKDNSGR